MSLPEKLFAALAASEKVANSDLQAAGHQIYEFVKAISNDNQADSGAGLDVYDIWFKYGDAKIFLTMKNVK